MAANVSDRVDLARTLLTTASTAQKAIASALRPTGLGLPHYLVISHLREQTATSTSGLSDVALVPPATLTRTLDKLVDLALVYRTLDSTDRRRVMVRLSERGAATAHECEALVDAAMAEAFPWLRHWETQAVIDILHRETTPAVASDNH